MGLSDAVIVNSFAAGEQISYPDARSVIYSSHYMTILPLLESQQCRSASTRCTQNSKTLRSSAACTKKQAKVSCQLMRLTHQVTPGQ